MPAVTTADQVVREDLSPAFLNIDARKTPLIAQMKRGEQLGNVLYSWTIETYDGRRTDGVPENKDADSFETNKQYRVWNRVQKFWRTPHVTTEANDINVAPADFGRMKKEIVSKTREQQRDCEQRICDDRSSKDDDGVSGREFLGLGMVINDGVSVGMSNAALVNADAQTQIPAQFTTPTAQIYTGLLTTMKTSDGSNQLQVFFDQNQLLNMLQNRFDNVGMTTELSFFCDALLKRHTAQFFGKYAPQIRVSDTVVRTPQAAVDENRLNITGVDMIETDFGPIDIHLVSFMPRQILSAGAPSIKTIGAMSGRGYLLDMEHVRLRPSGLWLTYQTLEDKGAGPRGLLQSIIGYEFGDPRGHCKVDPNIIQTTV
jgi:hypothetical protein